MEVLTLKGIKKIPASWQEKKAKREKITISIGISLFPMKQKGLKDLIIRADEALYKSKKRGRDRVTFYE